MKKKSKVTTKYVRWCWNFFCIVFFYKKNSFRDFCIFAASAALVISFFGFNWDHIKQKLSGFGSQTQNQQDVQLSESESMIWQEKEIKEIQAKTLTGSWTPYQNLWYGYSLKYPNDWLDPVIRKPEANNAWEQKVEFRMSRDGENNPYEGLDIEIYSVAKTKELSNTNEYPKLKNAELSNVEECSTITGHFLETGDYPAEEIYIPISDPCYNAALFFSNTRNNYMYVIVPKVKEGGGIAGDPAREIVAHLPEFFSVVSNWNLIDIQRPKTAPAKVKTNAPHPAAYKVVSGRKVCDKSNDKPAKSKKGKGRHLDMECCLDPDEYPNPNCYYDPGKYGKYL